MRKFTFWLSALMLVFGINLATAQTKVISGKVTDASGPLPGVSVVIKGTTKGTQTDFDGKYSLTANVGDVLQFTFVGMETASRTVGAANVIDLKMAEGALALEEVVVTALGVVKKKDADLSSSTTVDTKSLQKSGESGVIQALAGKTSGLRITKTTGDPGSGAYMQIRGQNTILGDASPLIILDGVPIANSNIGSGTAGVIQQSRLNDLSSDDIENVTVLKGAAAAAVWGTGAANGVIIINTKAGKIGAKKMSIEVRNSIAIDKINVEFEKQQVFGQGLNGVWQANGLRSFGDKVSLRSGAPDAVTVGNLRFESYQTGKIYYPITAKNDKTNYNKVNRDQVFGDGFTWDKSVSINYGAENSSTFLSFSDWDQKGIINAGSNYRRQTLRANQTTKLTDDLTVKFNTSYAKVKSDRIQTGSNVEGLYLSYLRNPLDFDNTDYKGVHYNASGTPTRDTQRAYRNYLGIPLTSVFNNPGWTLNEQDNPNKVERFTIAPEFNWNIRENMKLTARYGLDYYTDHRETYFPVHSGGGNINGFYGQDDIQEKTQNFNVFLQTNYDLTDAVKLNWILGATLDRKEYARISGTSSTFVNPFVGDLRIFSNSTAANTNATSYKEESRKSGGYVVLNADIYDQLLLELTGRYERPSSLEANTFYPSASLGWLFSKNFESDFLSFGKFRATYGEIGIEPAVYSTSTTYAATNIASSWGDVLNASVYGNPFARSLTLGNPLLKEERVKEFEIGTDLRFLQNKVTLGLTYYDRTTEDAILNLDVAPSTGFGGTLANAAEITNKGIEIDLGLKLISKGDFNWNMNMSYSQNKNMVESLSGVQSVFLAGFTGVSSRVVEGQPMGALWGVAWNRDATGKLILDANGFPTAAPAESVLGDPNPDWMGGLGTTISYKGLTLSAQLETSQGNDMWSGTKGAMINYGTWKSTGDESVAPSDIKTSAGVVIPAGTTFRGHVQDFGAGPVALTQTWWMGTGGGFGPVGEQFVEDASWTRIREISLAYTLPVKYLKSTGLTSVEVSASGRNLALWTDVEGYDPDSNLTGPSKGRGLDYFGNPSTKSYLFTLKLGF
jgi:TonB-linked SusC/RagA family outer membrane protein